MDEKIAIAERAAAGVLQEIALKGQMGLPDCYEWLLIGCNNAGPAGEVIEEAEAYNRALTAKLDHLAEFVRAFPDAPLEALYRHARSCGVHDRPSDGFDDVDPAFRIAYAVFRATLIEADRVFLEEERRAAAKAAQDRPQPPLLINAEDTILEQHGSIFDKVGDRPQQVNLGGPVVASDHVVWTEGEGGDAPAANDVAGVDQAAVGDAPTQPMEAEATVDAGATDGATAMSDAAGSDEGVHVLPPGAVEASSGSSADEPGAGKEGVVAASAVEGASADTPPNPADDSPGAPPAPVKRKKR